MKRFAAVSLMVIAVMFALVAGCVNDPKPEFGEMTDARDSQTYQTVKLGNRPGLLMTLTTRPQTAGAMGMIPRIVKCMEGSTTGKRRWTPALTAGTWQLMRTGQPL